VNRLVISTLFMLGLCAGALSPADAQTMSAQPAVATRTLSNGLQIYVVEDHAAPVVETAVWYRFGSLYETPGRTGLAHALEHMMFRGSARVSAAGLDDIVAHLGAQMNAETNYDFTHFFFLMPADKLSVALTVEADRMRHALIAPSEWRIERGAVLSEIDGDLSSPFFSLQSAVRAAAYPGSAAGATPLGKRADVAAATAADIARYYRQWYAPNNAALVVGGDVHAADVCAQAERVFGAIPAKKLPPIAFQHPVAARGKTADSAFPFPFEVLDLAYAVPGDIEAGEPEISTLAALINNVRAPFYRALVESNIALAVTANADTQLRGGLLNVLVVLNPGRSPAEAQAVFENAMAQSLKNGFDPELVAAAKRSTIAERVLDTDSVGGLTDLVGYTYGIVRERVEDEDRRLSAITAASLLHTARTYLANPAVVGHLSPNAQPPAGGSQKISATATDNFSARVPNGRVVMPATVARAIRTPTAARSKLAPVRYRLANGMTVIVQTRRDRPTVSVRGVIDANPAFEPEGQAGVARLASDVANFGTEHQDFAAQRKAIDDLGAIVTLGEIFTARGFATDLDAMLGILADAEQHPSFPEHYFTQERDQLANSIAQELNISGQAVNRNYLRLLLSPQDAGLRFPTPQSVHQLRRNDLLAYVHRFWRPDLTTIAIVGNVSPQQARASVERAFGSWEAPGAPPDTRERAYPAARAAHAYVPTEAGQVYIKLGQPLAARTSADYDALALLNQILGGAGAFESRLWNEMRQKRGLVYSVSSRLNAERDRGDLSIELDASPQNVVSAVRFVRSQLVRLQREPVSQTEITDARARVASGTLLSEEAPANELIELTDMVRLGLPQNYYATLRDRFERVSPADLMRVAREYLRPDALIEIYAGPGGPWADHAVLGG